LPPRAEARLARAVSQSNGSSEPPLPPLISLRIGPASTPTWSDIAVPTVWSDRPSMQGEVGPWLPPGTDARRGRDAGLPGADGLTQRRAANAGIRPQPRETGWRCHREPRGFLAERERRNERVAGTANKPIARVAPNVLSDASPLCLATASPFDPMLFLSFTMTTIVVDVQVLVVVREAWPRLSRTNRRSTCWSAMWEPGLCRSQ
jgi:hypothetical protein